MKNAPNKLYVVEAKADGCLTHGGNALLLIDTNRAELKDRVSDLLGADCWLDFRIVTFLRKL